VTMTGRLLIASIRPGLTPVKRPASRGRARRIPAEMGGTRSARRPTGTACPAWGGMAFAPLARAMTRPACAGTMLRPRFRDNARSRFREGGPRPPHLGGPAAGVRHTCPRLLSAAQTPTSTGPDGAGIPRAALAQFPVPDLRPGRTKARGPPARSPWGFLTGRGRPARRTVCLSSRWFLARHDEPIVGRQGPGH